MAKFFGLGVLAVGIGFGIYWLNKTFGQKPHGELVFFLAIPGAYSIVGLVEAISGNPFRTYVARWQSLRGWQRGVLGILIIAVAIAVMLASLVAFAHAQVRVA